MSATFLVIAGLLYVATSVDLFSTRPWLGGAFFCYFAANVCLAMDTLGVKP